MLTLSLTYEGHRVRMVGSADRPEWIAKDVCRVLGIHQSREALRRAGVTPDERGSVELDTLGGPQQVTTVTEAGLWKLVLQSRKPTAQRFKSWLCSAVLPCIRRHGCYPAPADRAAAALDVRDASQLAPITLQLIQYVQELEPKAKALDALSAADGDVGLQEAGRILGVGPNLFVRRLLEDGILFRGQHGKPTPYSQYQQPGYFRVVLTEPDHSGQTFPQTKVTPLGMTWLAGRYRATSALQITEH